MDRTYKLFAAQAFRVTLAQQFNVGIGAKCRLVIPVQVHGQLQENGEPYNIDTGSAYWRVTINGYAGKWHTYGDFQDREWFAPEKLFVAVYGVVDILIEFEGHALAGHDFFIDDIQFECDDALPPEPEPVECKGLPRVQYERTYILFAQDASIEFVNRVMSEYHQYRYTYGFSARRCWYRFA